MIIAPKIATPLDAPLLILPKRCGSSRAVNALRHALQKTGTKGTCLIRKEKLSDVMYPHHVFGPGKKHDRQHIHTSWNLIVHRHDRAGVFFQAKNYAHERGLAKLATFVVRVAPKVSWQGITRDLNLVDLSDPLENPRFPQGMGEAVREAFALEMAAWNAMCMRHQTVSFAHDVEGTPPWFTDIATFDRSTKADLVRFLQGVVLMDQGGKSSNAQPILYALGGAYNGHAATEPIRLMAKKTLAGSGFRHPSLLERAAAYLNHPQSFWPVDQRTNQSFGDDRGVPGACSLGPKTIARSVDLPMPTTSHAVMETIQHARFLMDSIADQPA